MLLEAENAVEKSWRDLASLDGDAEAASIFCCCGWWSEVLDIKLCCATSAALNPQSAAGEAKSGWIIRPFEIARADATSARIVEKLDFEMLNIGWTGSLAILA